MQAEGKNKGLKEYLGGGVARLGQTIGVDGLLDEIGTNVEEVGVLAIRSRDLPVLPARR